MTPTTPPRYGGLYPWRDVPLYELGDAKRIKAQVYACDVLTKNRAIVYVEAHQFLFDVEVVRDEFGYEASLLNPKGEPPTPLVGWDEHTDPWGIHASAVIGAMVAWAVPGALALSLVSLDDLLSPDFAVMLPGARA